MTARLQSLPRWIVYLFDLIIIEFAVFFSILVRFNFSVSHLLSSNVYLVFLVTLVTNAILFFTFRTYSGIIRYTTQRDTSRLLLVNVFSSIVYAGIGAWASNGHVVYNEQVYLLSKATIVINFLVVNFLLIGYRVLVRHLYKQFFSSQLFKHRAKVAVFDTSEHGLLTKRVVNDYPDSHMEVVAYIDDKLSKKGKVLEGLQIVGVDEVGMDKLKRLGVTIIVVANRNIQRETLNQLVDIALKYTIRVQQIPPIQQWLNGKLASEQLKDIKIEDLLEREVIKINNESIFYELKDKKILVTGAAGSIGSEIVRQALTYRPSLVILCDKAETPMHEVCLELKEKYPNSPFKAYMGDICDRVRMEHLFEVFSPDIVFHAAAYKHVPLMEENPSVAVINNVLGTKILAELSVSNGVSKFVMVSTDKAVNPTNVMGASKRIAEIYIQSYYRHCVSTSFNNNSADNPTKFVTTRFGNVLGSNGSVIPRFKQQIEKGGPLTVTHPEITRYFMTIPEACQLVIEAGVMGQGGEIFVFDMGEPVKIVDLANKMIRLSGRQPNEDIEIVFSGLRPGEKLYEELLNNSENTMPTYHEKIMIATVRQYDFIQISDKINRLIDCASKHFTLETVGLMKEIVPEFISKNSTFESLDLKLPS